MLKEARRRARRSRGRARVAAVKRLAALDSARPHRPPSSASTGARSGPQSPQPSGVLVALAHWRDQLDAPTPRASSKAPHQVDRSQILHDCIESLLDLDVERVVTAVLTNDPDQTAWDLSSGLAGEVLVSAPGDVASLLRADSEARKVIVIGWRPGLILRNGFYLTWAHKPLFRHALRDPRLSHFVYLEDDIRFTRESLSYWCRFREPLGLHGLLPGFVRYEVLGDARYVVDQAERQDIDPANRRCVVLSQFNASRGSETDLRFVNLDNPYQGMYVADRELVIDHLWSSPARSPLLSSTIRWPHGIRERASMGPIFDDVPAGFQSRNAVPVQKLGSGEYRLEPSCLVEHLTGNYSRSQSIHGKIQVDEMFLRGVSDRHEAGISPRQ